MLKLSKIIIKLLNYSKLSNIYKIIPIFLKRIILVIQITRVDNFKYPYDFTLHVSRITQPLFYEYISDNNFDTLNTLRTIIYILSYDFLENIH